MSGLIALFDEKQWKLAIKKIKCPIHHVVKPGCYAWKTKPNPLLKNISNEMAKRFGIRKWVHELDAYGRKIPDYNNHYQPIISAAYAREHIYCNDNPICLKCRRCQA